MLSPWPLQRFFSLQELNDCGQVVTLGELTAHPSGEGSFLVSPPLPIAGPTLLILAASSVIHMALKTKICLSLGQKDICPCP